MSNWGKIAIGTRLNDRCDPRFFNCWSHLIAGGLRKNDTVLDSAIELPQHFAGTVLATHFLYSDADTLLMVDTDMIFGRETLNHLRDAEQGKDYDILSALSVTRRRPFYPIVLGRQDNWKKENKPPYKCLKEQIDGSIIDVDSVGTGFTLIRRSVFEKMNKQLGIEKWFFDWGDNGVGEDTRFCQRAEEIGCRIGVHTGVSIGHRGPVTFYWNVEKGTTEIEASDQVKSILTK